MERLYESGLTTIEEAASPDELWIIENTRGNFLSVTVAGATASKIYVYGIKYDATKLLSNAVGVQMNYIVMRTADDADAMVPANLDPSDTSALAVVSQTDGITLNTSGAVPTTLIFLGVEAYDAISVTVDGAGEVTLSVTLANA